MTRARCNGRPASLVAIALLAAALAAACTQRQPPEPGRLRVANLVQRSPSISLDICPAQAGACRHQAVPRGRLGPTLSLPPARYRIALHTGGKTLSYFTIGIGADEDYSLALYGADLSDTSAPGAWSRVQRALGGSDARRVDAFRVTHRLLTLHTGATKDPATLRLANLAPGTTAFAEQLLIGEQCLDVPAVSYGGIGDSVRVPHADAALMLHWPDRDAPLTRRKLHLPGGSSSVAYVSALEDGRVQLLVDSRAPPP